MISTESCETPVSSGPDAAALLAQIRQLRAEVAHDAASRLERWRPFSQREEFADSAANLAHYLALREHDLAPLQRDLARLGLSSLGRGERRVMPLLDAVAATLARLADAERTEYPAEDSMRAGEAALARHTIELFGADPAGPYSRIMVTLPSEAANEPRLLQQTIAAGADCFRINCAHDGPDAWGAMIRNIQDAAGEAGRKCPVLMDLGGPKCRIVEAAGEEKPRLFRGSRLMLRHEIGSGLSGGIEATINVPEVLGALAVGHEVWIDDGKVGARVLATFPDAVELEVLVCRAKGVRLKPGKGVNFPDTELTLPPLTAKDLEDLDFVARHADLVGYSFVQRPQDIEWLQRELQARRPGRPLPGLVLKIETRLAIRNLPDLIVAGAGRQPLAVMLARGDLAVEVGFERMSEIQEEILWICEAAHVPVIWATQVLEGLIKDGAPSRAEATDAAMAQRAECVMLNKGPFIVEGVRFLDDVLRRMDRHQAKKTARLSPLGSWRAAPAT
jgi:pyruvate kinase